MPGTEDGHHQITFTSTGDVDSSVSHFREKGQLLDHTGHKEPYLNLIEFRIA